VILRSFSLVGKFGNIDLNSLVNLRYISEGLIFYDRRGRNAGCPTPPTQSRTCGFPASGSSVVLASASVYPNAH
jgi:hypothetical protein